VPRIFVNSPLFVSIVPHVPAQQNFCPSDAPKESILSLIVTLYVAFATKFPCDSAVVQKIEFLSLLQT